MTNYQVLARKWRPQMFADMIGQDHVLRALVNALDNQRIHHAYLFTGMRGVGKTTIARIFAKCLNCETNGVSATPCGTCSACQDIDAGRFFDLIEVDAASRTKVDETRELLENVPYAPASGRYKVYLIDEVHMFSTHSFNALLKTLEEPPEHVKFLLATTDPQKVPVTVLSRCLQFNLKRMASTRLADYLGHILDSENMAHDKPALELIARAADGSVRDSLSLVEQAAAFGGGEVRASDVESMLGRVSTDRLIDLIEAVGEGDTKTLFERVDALAEYSPDYVQITGEMLSLLHRIAMIQSVPGSVDESLSNGDRLQSVASQISAEEVQLYYQIGQHARRDMPFSSDQREAFDMALLRMIAFAPQSDLPAITAPAANSAPAPHAAAVPSQTSARTPRTASVEKSDANQAGVTDALKKTSTPNKNSADAVASNAVSTNTANADTDNTSGAGPDSAAASKKNDAVRKLAAAAIAAANAPDPVDVATPARHSAAPKPNKVASAPAQEPTTKPDSAAANASANNQSLNTVELDSINVDSWAETVGLLALSGMPRQLASQCVFHTRENTRINLQIEEQQSHLNTAQFRARLQTALSETTRSDVSIEIVSVSEELNTPARIAQHKKDQALIAARAAIDEDPMVKQLLDSVDGVVDEKSVQPMDESETDTNN